MMAWVKLWKDNSQRSTQDYIYALAVTADHNDRSQREWIPLYYLLPCLHCRMGLAGDVHIGH